MKPSLKITCRIEELSVLGGFLLSSMESSLGDFTAYAPDMDGAYVAAVYAELAVISALKQPKQVTAERKVITMRIYEESLLLREQMNLLEGYAMRADGLSIDWMDLGISAVRTKIKSKDVEGLLSAVAFLISNVEDNMAALSAVGYTASQHAALTAAVAGLKVDVVAHNDMRNERNNLATENYAKFNAFWLRLQDIADAGKRIYRWTAPNRVDDFTISTLIGRMRAERRPTLISGVVEQEAVPVKGAKIILIPKDGGHRRIAWSKSDGGYEMRGMKAGNYRMQVEIDGKWVWEGAVDVVNGVRLEVDVGV